MSLPLPQGDEGGERVLQQRWTSFLKAQLLCSRPDDGFPFNVLQDVFTLSPSPQDWRDTLFYGVFTSQWYGPRGPNQRWDGWGVTGLGPKAGLGAKPASCGAPGLLG